MARQATSQRAYARGESSVQRAFDIVFRRNRQVPDVPVCPDHNVSMALRGKMGRPTRFSAQTEEDYTAIYFCPVPGCNQTETRVVARTQIPVPGEPPARPVFGRDSSKSSL
jgi:hypothetical protein